MMSLIFLLLAILCLLLLVMFLLEKYDSRRQYMETENQRLHRLLEEQFLMQEDSLEAYRKMLDVACREKGFWEEDDTE